MKQLIEEQREEYVRIASYTNEYGYLHKIPKYEDVWNWHKQSLKQFIDELIAMEEGEIKEFQTQKDGEYHFGKNQKTIGWNLAKEFTIAHLKELKEELN